MVDEGDRVRCEKAQQCEYARRDHRQIDIHDLSFAGLRVSSMSPIRFAASRSAASRSSDHAADHSRCLSTLWVRSRISRPRSMSRVSSRPISRRTPRSSAMTALWLWSMLSRRLYVSPDGRVWEFATCSSAASAAFFARRVSRLILLMSATRTTWKLPMIAIQIASVMRTTLRFASSSPFRYRAGGEVELLDHVAVYVGDGELTAGGSICGLDAFPLTGE